MLCSPLASVARDSSIMSLLFVFIDWWEGGNFRLWTKSKSKTKTVKETNQNTSNSNTNSVFLHLSVVSFAFVVYDELALGSILKLQW